MPKSASRNRPTIRACNWRPAPGSRAPASRNPISLPSSLWAVGATLAQPLFPAAGSVPVWISQPPVTRTPWRQYRQTVLVAFQQVEDALAGLQMFATAAKSQDRALADSHRALNIALNRYTGGLVTYLDVVTARRACSPISARPRRSKGAIGGFGDVGKGTGRRMGRSQSRAYSLKPNLKTMLLP